MLIVWVRCHGSNVCFGLCCEAGQGAEGTAAIGRHEHEGLEGNWRAPQKEGEEHDVTV